MLLVDMLGRCCCLDEVMLQQFEPCKQEKEKITIREYGNQDTALTHKNIFYIEKDGSIFNMYTEILLYLPIIFLLFVVYYLPP